MGICPTCSLEVTDEEMPTHSDMHSTEEPQTEATDETPPTDEGEEAM